ncbi:MAG: thioredoxin family protein [Candidatus Krumholzibacteriia bacterium]
MKVLVLGTGCAKCSKLYDHAAAAIAATGVSAELEKVSDIQAILAHGVMMTPALVIDGVVKVAGKVPDVDEIAGWLV